MGLRESWLSRVTSGLSERDAWLLDRASANLEANIMTSQDKPMPWAPLRGICPSPTHYRGIWNWDSAFHMIAVGRWDPILAREQVRILLDGQQPSGLVPDVLWEDGSAVTNFGKPPVLPWACVRVEELGNLDLDFLRYCYDHFKPYEAFWRRERGGDAEGLFHYDSAATEAEAHRVEAKFESGWDNSVRWDVGIDSLWPIDLNCFMIMLYNALEKMAIVLHTGDEGGWSSRARQLADQINSKLWDDERGVYSDVQRADGKWTGILSPASFMPLFVGIAPADRARRSAEVAADPGKFYPGMPTVSYDNPAYSTEDFWRGPTWVNVAWFACKGLKSCGFDLTADEIRKTILDWCGENADSLYEHYNSRNGQGQGAKTYGWTAALVIEFILDWPAQR